MATLKRFNTSREDPSTTDPDAGSATCDWQAELQRMGAPAQSMTAIDTGVPVLVLAALGIAAALAVFAAAGEVVPLGVALIIVASLPWVRWLRVGDEGPSWSFVVHSMAPIAALGIGYWFAPAIDPGSDLAYPLLAFPGLFLVVLGLAAARDDMATGIGVASYVSYGGPLLTAWGVGQEVDGVAVVTWHVGFALSVVAGFAVRFSSNANAAVAAAREAMAWQAAAEERRQVAREVHDVIAHTLAVTMLHVTAARMAVQRSDLESTEAALEEAERQGRSSLADIRHIVRVLRADETSVMESSQPGLAHIEELVEVYRAAGLSVDHSVEIRSDRWSPASELAVFRVLQEALTNAARHGNGPASVRLDVSDERMSLTVKNPIGQPHVRRTQGSGLNGMRERIEAAGGTLETTAGAGFWTVRAVVPGEAAA